MATAGARVLLGTASWTDRPLIASGRFYPAGAKTAETRLRYYASRYPLVEADSSYYGLPTAETARAWVARTPPGFTFDVKAYSLFTDHPAPIVRLPKEIQGLLPAPLAGRTNLYRKDTPAEVVDLCWATFVDALLPLHEAGRLGVVVFQFPKWVFPGRGTHRYLEEVRSRLGPYRGAVEFRNERWMAGAQQETTLALLGELGLSYIAVDEPQGFASSVPPVAAAPASPALVRFHGRNAETWEKRTRTSAERFDYYYRPEELAEWVPRIKTLTRAVPEVHLVMNTNNYDQGPANLELLRGELQASGIAVESWPGERATLTL
ncbi:MAG: DUF72 domain-containing protein [Dehalococcoidia bacterium]|nr:DUF72 domain-containing protein [Dehalococcoidia bacterium]